jgi:predicted LPLAT superfamily acyltransferase
MKEYIDKLKEIETLVELSIGTTMTEDKATDIYAVTNDLMCKVKKLNIPVVMQRSEQLISLLEKLKDENMCSVVGDELIEQVLKEINCA